MSAGVNSSGDDAASAPVFYRPESWILTSQTMDNQVRCQHFFARGSGAQYFEVQRAEADPAN
jgi:hypothetical protein